MFTVPPCHVQVIEGDFLKAKQPISKDSWPIMLYVAHHEPQKLVEFISSLGDLISGEKKETVSSLAYIFDFGISHSAWYSMVDRDAEKTKGLKMV